MDDNAKWSRRARMELAAKELTRHGFTVEILPTVQAAKARVLELVPVGAKVGVGGSITVRELGVLPELEAKGCEIVQHWKPGLTREEDLEIRRRELLTDVFISSTNAVTMTGELVSIDGVGNRVASQIFGPGKTILVAGANKLAKDVTEGIWRVRNVASPPNCRRLNIKTPCAVTGQCSDCNSPERTCRVVTIMERQPSRSQITLLFVEEDLGY